MLRVRQNQRSRALGPRGQRIAAAVGARLRVAQGTEQIEIFDAVVGVVAVAVLELEGHGLVQPKRQSVPGLEHNVAARVARIRPAQVAQQAAFDLRAVGGAVAHEYAIVGHTLLRRGVQVLGVEFQGHSASRETRADVYELVVPVRAYVVSAEAREVRPRPRARNVDGEVRVADFRELVATAISKPSKPSKVICGVEEDS
jgi:hypothetical protein